MNNSRQQIGNPTATHLSGLNRQQSAVMSTGDATHHMRHHETNKANRAAGGHAGRRHGDSENKAQNRVWGTDTPSVVARASPSARRSRSRQKLRLSGRNKIISGMAIFTKLQSRPHKLPAQPQQGVVHILRARASDNPSGWPSMQKAPRR